MDHILQIIKQNLKEIWMPRKQKEAETVVYNLVNLKQELQNLRTQFMEKLHQSLLIIDEILQYLQIQLISLKMSIDQNQNLEIRNPKQLKELIISQETQYNTNIGNKFTDLLTIWNDNFLKNFGNRMKKIAQRTSDCDLEPCFNSSNRPGNGNIKICQEHYQQINYVRTSNIANSQNWLACERCIQPDQNYIQLEELEKAWGEHARLTLGKFNNHQNNLSLYWKKILQISEEFNKFVSQQINLKNDAHSQQMCLMQKNWSSLSQVELNDIACDYNKQPNNLIYEKIEQESIKKEDQIQQVISQYQKFLEKLGILINQTNPKFELQNSIKQNKCISFAFSLDSSVMVVGQYCMIKVFQFREGDLTEQQELTEHQGHVRCLYFMKKTLQFVSGSTDNLIIIWSWNEKRKWYCDQILNGHSDYVRGGLIMNNKEDLIISGSDDKTIRFWVKRNNIWRLNQTLTDHVQEIKSISLNGSENQLVSCSTGYEIIVFKLNTEQQWMKKQQIQVDQEGYSLYFLSDTLFTFLSHKSDLLYIYEFDEPQQQFIKTKQIKLISGDKTIDYFPQQYNKEKQILLVKIGKTINIIKTIDQQQFVPVQFIENKDNYLYGAMTNDAEYLVTWESNDNTIKVRKCHQ
ncbi:unnamed protein product (macronuclear) [Paramecium tetraurelia]|uniref:Uncharacterized protein n=1 Tax=Paramecium tetraurelia TaxID=5888 RepID=A0E239_PARTE|nr:uncharacterized protein GSPATT00022528001 [Paramecium tetraurelia]CAK89356.1 unnamed protein product [Paramecium tetraurelia]|eukprot:XP_001456753.1 hypothetical protein (macronuclear) [Paramecium tetraurelia strain d4-2]